MGADGDGLPLSLQLAAAPGRDFELAAVADVYQRRTGWHEREPKLDVVPDLAPVCAPRRPPTASTPSGGSGWPGRSANWASHWGTTTSTR